MLHAELSLEQRADRGAGLRGRWTTHVKHNIVMYAVNLLSYCITMREISHKNDHNMRFEIFV